MISNETNNGYKSNLTVAEPITYDKYLNSIDVDAPIFVSSEFPEVYANRNGELFKVGSSEKIATSKSDGYHVIHTWRKSRRKVVHVGVHDIVCTIFKGKRPRVGDLKFIVNHKDGNTINNHPDNLEWTTYSGNILHAYKNELRNDNVPIVVWDILSDTKEEFYSMAEAGRKFNVQTSAIFRNVRSGDKIYYGHYVFRVKTDKRPWPKYTAADTGKHLNGMPRMAKGTCLSTGKVIECGSISELASAVGMKMATVALAIRKGRVIDSHGYKFELCN